MILGIPSRELPCFKTIKHAIYIIMSMNLDESCGASVLKHILILGLRWKLLRFGKVWGHCGPPNVQFLLVRSVGASLSESTFSWSPRFGNEENVINSMFLQENLTMLWSFGFEGKNNTQHRTLSKNTVFYDIKVKRLFSDKILELNA